MQDPVGSEQYAFFQALPSCAPQAGSCMLEPVPGSPDSHAATHPGMAAGMYDDFGICEPQTDSPRESNQSEPGLQPQPTQHMGSLAPVSSTAASPNSSVQTGSSTERPPHSPTFHAHRPAALKLHLAEMRPADPDGDPPSPDLPAPQPFDVQPAGLPAGLDRELLHARTVGRLMGKLNSPTKHQHAPEPTLLISGIAASRSSASGSTWRDSLQSTVDTKVCSPAKLLPAQGFGRAVGTRAQGRYPFNFALGGQTQVRMEACCLAAADYVRAQMG